MTNLDAFRDKFSQSGIRILDGALEEARKRNQNFISDEHLLYTLILQESDLFNAEMQHISADAAFIRAEIERLLEYSRKHLGEGFRIAPETTNIFKNSMDKARAENRRVIDASDILFSFLNDSHSLLSNILQNVEGVQETVTYSGQVRKIDLDEKYFELRNIENIRPQDIRCIYKDYSDSQAVAWLNKQVTITGINVRSYNQQLAIVQVKTVDVNSS